MPIELLGGYALGDLISIKRMSLPWRLFSQPDTTRGFMAIFSMSYSEKIVFTVSSYDTDVVIYARQGGLLRLIVKSSLHSSTLQ